METGIADETLEDSSDVFDDNPIESFWDAGETIAVVDEGVDELPVVNDPPSIAVVDVLADHQSKESQQDIFRWL